MNRYYTDIIFSVISFLCNRDFFFKSPSSTTSQRRQLFHSENTCAGRCENRWTTHVNRWGGGELSLWIVDSSDAGRRQEESREQRGNEEGRVKDWLIDRKRSPRAWINTYIPVSDLLRFLSASRKRTYTHSAERMLPHGFSARPLTKRAFKADFPRDSMRWCDSREGI